MGIVDMKKVQIVGLNSDKKAILDALMKAGCVEVTDENIDKAGENVKSFISKDSESDTVTALENEKLKITKALEFLEKIDETKKSLIYEPKEYSEDEIDSIWNDKKLLIEKTENIIFTQDNLNKLKIQKNKMYSNIDLLSPWKNNKIPLETDTTKETKVLRGVFLGDIEIDILKKEIETEIDLIYFEFIDSYGEGNCVLIVYHTNEEEKVADFTKKHGFILQNFDEFEDTAEKNIKRLENEIKELNSKIEDEEKNAKKFLEFKDKLEVLYDKENILIDRSKIVANFIKTDKTFMINGWIPKKKENDIKSKILSSWDVYLNFIEPDEIEECPVLLTNNKLGETVEGITNMYSVPSYKELDPNIIMAPFFILFFGLMLSDGGYGLVMVLVSLFAMKKFNFNNSMKKYVKLVLYCGLSTMFWGALFGGWFGIEYFNNFSLWFNPVEDPEELLKWSLVFGIFHLYIGIAVRGVNLFREGKYIDIIYDVIFWYIFFTGAIFFALPYAPKVDPDSVTAFVGIGKIMVLIGGVLLILTQGRAEKGIFKKFLGGISSIYELVSFMSDVLSYSRLLALGLATSVIASIVNEMALMIPLPLVIRVVVIALIFIGGHTFNFAINALGAYVHSSRLQYIEFFGKFYKGGGKAFEPFKQNTKFINIK
jgi:V/A-type H+-transporting ATPase subunit I